MKDRIELTIKDGMKLYLKILFAQCLVAAGIVLGILILALIIDPR